MGRHDQVTYYKRMFWAEENTKYAEPHFRLRKMATVVNRLAGDRPCSLLDVGCGPATLARLLRPNIDYHGIDIAIQEPAPNLKEMDILESRVDFDGRRFDLVVAQGVFEYLGEHQDSKLSEIAELLDEGGRFVTTYVNFDHRRPSVYWPYSNVQDAAAFRRALERRFVIERQFPSSLNWAHSEPNRAWLRLLNMPIRFRVPFVDRNLSVEYFYVCAPRAGGPTGAG